MISPRVAAAMVRKFADDDPKFHFGSDAFSANKRIFATVWYDKNTVNLRLSPDEQKRLLLLDGEGFVEIDNAWGKQGWTTVQLEFVDKEQFLDALKSAWLNSANNLSPLKKLGAVKKKTIKKKKVRV